MRWAVRWPPERTAKFVSHCSQAEAEIATAGKEHKEENALAKSQWRGFFRRW